MNPPWTHGFCRFFKQIATELDPPQGRSMIDPRLRDPGDRGETLARDPGGGALAEVPRTSGQCLVHVWSPGGVYEYGTGRIEQSSSAHLREKQDVYGLDGGQEVLYSESVTLQLVFCHSFNLWRTSGHCMGSGSLALPRGCLHGKKN